MGGVASGGTWRNIITRGFAGDTISPSRLRFKVVVNDVDTDAEGLERDDELAGSTFAPSRAFFCATDTLAAEFGRGCMKKNQLMQKNTKEQIIYSGKVSCARSSSSFL